MRKLKTIPERAAGSVGDKVSVAGRIYVKAANGVWGLVADANIKASIKNLYVAEGRTLREVASLISDKHQKVLSSFVQKVCNEHGWMRSHYGRKDAGSQLLSSNKTKVYKLYSDHAFSLREIAHVTGVHVNTVSGFFKREFDIVLTGRHPDKERRSRVDKLDNHQVATWNRLLSLDGNTLTYPQYIRAVRQLSNFVYKIHASERNALRSMTKHLDHRMSIADGYYETVNGLRKRRKCVVPITALSHRVNLRLAKSWINLKKGDKSAYGESELMDRIKFSKIKLLPINRLAEIEQIAKQLKVGSINEKRKEG